MNLTISISRAITDQRKLHAVIRNYLSPVPLTLFNLSVLWVSNLAGREDLGGIELFEKYCFDCHDKDTQK